MRVLRGGGGGGGGGELSRFVHLLSCVRVLGGGELPHVRQPLSIVQSRLSA